MIAVSVVSHGQGALVERLVARLRAFPEVSQIIVTLNVPEPCSLQQEAGLSIISNDIPKGFGANHNAAFQLCSAPCFCVLNPDIELPANPFPELLPVLEAPEAVMAAPLVVSPSGQLEDSVRQFPTLGSLLQKILFGKRGVHSLKTNGPPFSPEWVAGMFMLFRSAAFADLAGFDEGYYMYYEDVDICWRIRRQKLHIVVCPVVHVVHDARRDSHRNFKYLRWHVSSMLRYLKKCR